MPNFGTIGFLESKKKAKQIYIQLNNNFCKLHKLRYHQQQENDELKLKIVNSPSARPEYPEIAKSCGIEKHSFHATLLNLINCIG
jgi:hypothetical protein